MVVIERSHSVITPKLVFLASPIGGNEPRSVQHGALVGFEIFWFQIAPTALLMQDQEFDRGVERGFQGGFNARGHDELAKLKPARFGELTQEALFLGPESPGLHGRGIGEEALGEGHVCPQDRLIGGLAMWFAFGSHRLARFDRHREELLFKSLTAALGVSFDLVAIADDGGGLILGDLAGVDQGFEFGCELTFLLRIVESRHLVEFRLLLINAFGEHEFADQAFVAQRLEAHVGREAAEDLDPFLLGFFAFLSRRRRRRSRTLV